jgi:hydrophobe/amphiphile efflux-3 (HAE3) family protein
MIARLVGFSYRHSFPVILAILLITVFLGFFALGIRIDPEALRLLPSDFKTNELIEKYGGETTDIDYLVLVLSAEELFTLEKLAGLQAAAGRIESLKPVRGSITPLNLMTFRKLEGRLALLPLSRKAVAPATEADLQAFRSNISSDPLAKNFVLSEDGKSFGLIFPTEVQENYRELLGEVEEIVSALETDYEVSIAGWIPLHEATRSFILRDPPRLIAVAVGITFLVFLVSFATARALFLPLLTISIGMVWTLGIMSLAGTPLSIIGVMIPPLIFALGSSYSIHILNQYYYEADPSSKDRSWIVPAICRITKTILLASLTTAFGFGSLLVASIQRIREFGVFTALAVLACALLTLFLFPAVLARLRSPLGSHRNRVTRGILASLMAKLGLRVKRMRTPVLVFLLGICVAFGFSLRSVKYETDFTSYYRGRVEAVEDNRILMEKLGGFVYLNLTVTAPENERNYFLDSAVLEEISRFEEEIKKNPDVVEVTSFVSYLKALNSAMNGRYAFPQNRAMILLLSRFFKAYDVIPEEYANLLADKSFASLTLQIRVYDSERKWFPFESKLREIVGYLRQTASQSLPDEINPELWGWNLIALELSEILVRDQIVSILAAAALIFLITALAFRSFTYGALSLIPLATGIMLNFVLMWALNIPFDVLTIMFSSVAIGVGVDDSIHLLIQYRRFRRLDSKSSGEALSLALERAGRPILLTSISIIAGLQALAFSSFLPVLYFGMLISIALLATTFGALVILPVFLSFSKK